MTKTEFLEELKSALQGEVSSGVIQENTIYYDNYISQELRNGRSEDEIIGELGGPRIIARTIIDSSEAAGDGGGADGAYYSDPGSAGASGSYGEPGGPVRTAGKWYTKLIITVVVLFVLFIVFSLVGGIFSLLFRFAGPLIFIWLAYSLFKGMRK